MSTTATESDILPQIKAVVEAMVAASGGRLRLAEHEEDTTRDPQPQAATFLKVDEKRRGRDLQLLNFMAKLEGPQAAIVRVLEEIVIPTSPFCVPAYNAGLKELMKLEDMFEQERRQEWKDMLTEFLKP